MSSRKTLILIAAIAAGVFAGVALLNYVRGIESDVYADAQPVEVLIATADIPEGTPVAQALDSIERQQIPLNIRPATFVSPDNLDPITGLVSQGEIVRNQIIVKGLFVDPSVVTLSLKDQIPTGNVAFSMELDTVRAVGGYLQPGDEVNMMITHGANCATEEDATDETLDFDELGTVDNGQGNSFGANISDESESYCTFTQPARYLYQRVEILAIGARQQIQTGEVDNRALTPQGGTITFMVPPEAAQLLASVAPGDVYLTLLPEDYVVEALPALTAALMSNATPAELSDCATPYGPDGFIEGDATTVSEGVDLTSNYVLGHCVPIWLEEGE
ncbi:MAG: hypothetical protein DHS20C19_18540 [Acidimicrobiales bacterium]|nr:MAG: hypothetical protein DHS20C19_18540 [Acidimicrobiales bacterium]